MRLAGTLLSYVIAVGVLCAVFVGGGMWLLNAAPSVVQGTRVAPIPPRIAESIERRKPLPVRVEEPEPAKPAMKEANVSLTPAPTFRIREPVPPARQTRKPRRDGGVPAQDAAPVAPAAVVTTARSDVPY